MYAAIFSTGRIVIHQGVTLKLSCPGLKEELEKFNWGGRSSNKAICNMDLASCKYLFSNTFPVMPEGVEHWGYP